MKKILFKKGALENKLTYPIDKKQLSNLKKCKLVNPFVGKQHGLMPFDFSKQEEFLNEVLEVRLLVQKGIYPYEFMMRYNPFPYSIPFDVDTIESGELLPGPLLDEGLTSKDPQKLAEVVHMDSPIDAPSACLTWVLNDGANLKKHEDKYIDFLGTVPNAIENIADGVKLALRKGFEAKYYFGVGRPEEILEEKMGAAGKLLTQYPEGCPNHPSYPAGHGCAVAGGVAKILNAFDLNEYQTQELLLTAYQWSMFRSFAGVHYAVDNVAGLAIGGLSKYFTKEAKKAYLV